MNLHFIEIAANLTDAVFEGVYHGAKKHAPDLGTVLSRARAHGVKRTIVTVGRAQEAPKAKGLCDQYAELSYTVGTHPTRSRDAGSGSVALSTHLDALRGHIRTAGPRLAAIGECGLDYDRLHFATREEQIPVFEAQFTLAEETGKPMFLHNRNTGGDFARIVRENRQKFTDGVAHSFTGGKEELMELLGLGLYIGVNGCSLKTADNLDVVKEIPLDKIMLETDSPYCEIRPTHAGYAFVTHPIGKVDLSKKKKVYSPDLLVKGRCEPVQIRQVCEVVAAVKGISQNEVAEAAFNNSMRVFFPAEAADMGPNPYQVSLATGTP